MPRSAKYPTSPVGKKRLDSMEKSMKDKYEKDKSDRSRAVRLGDAAEVKPAGRRNEAIGKNSLKKQISNKNRNAGAQARVKGKSQKGY